MRNWIDLFEHREAFLFHGTSITSALEIIMQDKLDAQGYYICLTREKSIARKFADIKSSGVIEEWVNVKPELFSDDDLSDEAVAKQLPVAWAEKCWTWGSTGGIIFYLDQTKLRQRYKLSPYSDSPDTQKWEMEERVTRDITPFKSLVRHIEVSRNFRSIMDMVLRGDENEGTAPQPQYREAFEFIMSKAI